MKSGGGGGGFGMNQIILSRIKRIEHLSDMLFCISGLLDRLICYALCPMEVI